MTPEHDTAGPGRLSTGDEPPFSVASGPWSMVEFGRKGARLRPNLVFDFEDIPGGGSSQLSPEWAHSGQFAYRMAPGTEYSPAVRRHVRDVAGPLSAVEVGLWMWSPSPRTMLTAVVSIDRDNKQLAWFGKDLQADTAEHAGQQLNCNFLIRDLALEPDDIVSVYLWKRGGEAAFIDDMAIFFHSTEVPGRKLGHAPALDSLRPGGPTPLAYAKVSAQDVPVDSTRFRPGMPAPSTTLAAVAFGGGRGLWQFVPDEGLAWLKDPAGTPLALVRPWSPATHRDVLHYDRVVAESVPQGIRITGCDVARIDGQERVAAIPAPVAVVLQLPAE